MPKVVLQGNEHTSDDKLEKLRQQIHAQKFQDQDAIRRFINRYVVANPVEARNKSFSVVREIVGNIRSELGLRVSDQPGIKKVISDQLKNLISGRAQATEDTARWAVHHAANRVTMYSGQFVYDAEDIFINGAGIDFRFQRTYKSQGYFNGPLGINWDHNYNLWLREVGASQKIVRLTGAFQESEYIQRQNRDYWAPPPGEHSVVFDLSDPGHRAEIGVKLPSNYQHCTYGLRFPDGTLHFYQRDQGDPIIHYIKRIEDRFGNYLEFNYGPSDSGFGDRLEHVEINNSARVVNFNYDTQDRIISIEDYKGRLWNYSYDDFDDLIAFTTPGTNRYKNGLTEQYVYSTPYFIGELQHNLIQLYDTAGRLYIENTYGTDPGLLGFNRVVRQREGNGERFFEYQDISLATGIPAGQSGIEEDVPAHQTVMTRRNGHPVHYIYNKVGNLIAKEEDGWAGGTRRRLVTHYRYNRDGALTGKVSPEGRVTQYLYGRDEFMHALGNPTENQLCQHSELNWKKRLSFGNRLAVVQRFKEKYRSNFQFPGPLQDIYYVTTDSKDIIVKFSYGTTFQNIESISDPRYTKSPFPGAQEDQKYKETLTALAYSPLNGSLESIKYPNLIQADQSELKKIKEHFLDYDGKGRLTQYEDRAGTRMDLIYFPHSTTPSEAPKEGYLRRQLIDQKNQSNLNGLNLETHYNVNEFGVVTSITLPKGTDVEFKVNNFNQTTKVIRTLSPTRKYETRYTYCRNMRTERIERDVQDENGQPLWGGTEVQFFHYDENDNISRLQIGSPDFSDHLVTHHTYDDGDLRVGTMLPRGNRIRIRYDERRLPKMIERGMGSSESVKVKVVYDGDGLLRVQRDGRGLKTEFDYDSFGRMIQTREYDEQDNLYRLIRQDYDKAGNLIIERLFKPDGNAYKLLYHGSYRYDELSQRIEDRLRRLQAPVSYGVMETEKDNDVVPITETARTLYFYDRAGRLRRVEQHGRRLDINGQPQPNNAILASKYEYNSMGWLIAETDPLGNRTEIRYDKHGLVTRVDVREKVPPAASPTGEETFTTLYKYDNLDRMTSISDGLGNTTQFKYDSRDARVRQIDPLGNVTRFEYDIYGRQVLERIEMTDTGLGSGSRQPNSDIVTQYVYDANGNLIHFIDAFNTPTRQAYDALDRRTKLQFVDGTETKYNYDGNDNTVWHQDNNGLINRTTYDPLDNPVRMDVDKSRLKSSLVVEGAMAEAFEYDELGQMTRAKNDWADIHFKVDSLGQTYEELVKFSDQAPMFTLKRAYDDFGFLSRLTYPNGRVLAYQPDGVNRIKRIENKAYGTNYPGNTNLLQQRLILENTFRGSRIIRKSYGNGASTDYAYDRAGRVISISHRDAQNAELLTVQHLYDAAGNMRFKREFASNDNYGEVYKYDSRSQLTLFQKIQPSPTHADRLNLKTLAPATSLLADDQYNDQKQTINPMLGSLAQVHNQSTFKYDKLGNRLEERVQNQPQPITYTPNSLNQYTQRNNTKYNYDSSGNLRQEKTGTITRNYIYNHRNQIVRVKEGGGDLAQFYHDALGRRVWSDTGGVKSYFLYDDENVVEEWRPTAQNPTKNLTQYVNEFEVDSRCQLAVSGTEYWYHKDLIGSSRLLSNMVGAQTMSSEGQPKPVRYRYTPFGRLMKPLPDLPNYYLFAGRRYYPTEEIYDLRRRSYKPSLGRFFQRDPNDLDQTPNLYWYCKNNGLTLIDPYGEQEKTAGDWAFLESVREMQLAWSQVLSGKGAKAKAKAALKTAGWLGLATAGALPWIIERPAILVSDVMAGVENTVGRRNLVGMEIALSQSGPGPGRPVSGSIYAARWYARFSRFYRHAQRPKPKGSEIFLSTANAASKSPAVNSAGKLPPGNFDKQVRRALRGLGSKGRRIKREIKRGEVVLEKKDLPSGVPGQNPIGTNIMQIDPRKSNSYQDLAETIVHEYTHCKQGLTPSRYRRFPTTFETEAYMSQHLVNPNAKSDLALFEHILVGRNTKGRFNYNLYQETELAEEGGAILREVSEVSRRNLFETLRTLEW